MTSNIISLRVAQCRAGEHPIVLARLPSGFAVMNDHQPEMIAGCCVLLPDPVVPSVNDLDAEARVRFMADFLLLGDAVLAATGAERINYLILCNIAPELHAHVIPRFSREDPEKRRQGPFEAYDLGASPNCEPEGVHRELIERIRAEIESRLGAR